MATDTTSADVTPAEQTDTTPAQIAGISLGPGEDVIHDTRPSYWNWPLWTLSLIGLFYPWFKRQRTRYIVTTNRVIVKRGRVSKETIEVHHEDIRQIQCTSGLAERLTRNGTIELNTAHDDCITLHAVPNQSTVANTIRDRRAKA